MGLILLVEDEPGAVALMRRYMENSSMEHKLAVFEKAAEALFYAVKNKVDLFILDIQLLDYRGTELARQLRSMPEYRFTPILFTTELAGEELSAYREIKCYDFLVKPFTEAEFHKVFRAALAMGEQMRAAPEILRIEQKQFLFEYGLEQILYIESFGKKAVIHSISQGKELNDQVSGYSLVRLLEMAGPGNLIQCHKSFLINPIYITKIDKGSKTLWLKNCKDTIPIGEKYQHNLRERTI